ncbi:MAG: X-Pro dipeptidyl-peptidase [Alphaproteobacteria bacterium]|nr:MAG: X-Pro dipeptidyl-peptidase [Alphaproteobacteria bacterium]
MQASNVFLVLVLCVNFVSYFTFRVEADEPKSPAPKFEDHHNLEVYSIPMRDGVKLNTLVFRPKNQKKALPIIFLRTPYDISRYRKEGPYEAFQGLAQEGYIFVFQDMRGTFASEGVFRLFVPDVSAKSQTSETSDAYDSIEWLTKNIPHNNGRVGMMGVSYGGWATIMALLDPHPALRAASPQAAPSNVILHDDFGHNGALRLSSLFGFSYGVESTSGLNFFEYDQDDLYTWFLQLGPLKNVNEKYFHNKIPTWNFAMEHPDYDQAWKSLEVTQLIKRRTSKRQVPILHVAGWWDAEDFTGALENYRAFEENDSLNNNHLVVGPWWHGAWSHLQQKKFGPMDFGDDTSQYFQIHMLGKFFAHHLKDRPMAYTADVLVYKSSANKWHELGHWPPKQNVIFQKFYMSQERGLSTSPPQDQGIRSFYSDPENPVPYSKRPISSFWTNFEDGKAWKVEDQRFLAGRPDVLSWQTEALDTPQTVAGAVKIDLYASTSGTDADWVVKIIDVYPDDDSVSQDLKGYQMLLSHDIIRAKYRLSVEQPSPLKPGEVYHYEIKLPERFHVFGKGHKIMIQIQSSLFPLFDRNIQHFISAPTAEAEDYKKALHSIYLSPTYPTSVSLPLLNPKVD